MISFLGLDVRALIEAVGYLGIFGIVFAESGLFVGFFLPGDSLLFTAGFLASQGYLNIFVLVFISFVGAVLGDNFGYFFIKNIWRSREFFLKSMAQKRSCLQDFCR